ncbi:hypothetical protein BH23ACT10_BH23ACT10_20580 [soil metagenome]
MSASPHRARAVVPGKADTCDDAPVAQILLVEDDPSTSEAVSLALEGFGHRVDTAATGDEALDRWRCGRPDLVLLDVMLPGRDGLEVW